VNTLAYKRERGRRKSRSGRGGPGRGRRILSRVAGISPRTAILLMLFALFVVLSISPVTRNLEATGRLKRMQDELKEQKATTESLEEDVTEAKSLEYIEIEARKQRLVAPGEILYLMTTDDDENQIRYRVRALQSLEEAWERVQRMLHSTPD
jgi:type II secretory pathway component PulM